jgi:hypothetical protein
MFWEVIVDQIDDLGLGIRRNITITRRLLILIMKVDSST